jgi:DNA topoisomerase I
VEGNRLLFRFRGKSRRQLSAAPADRRLAALVRRLRELPGQVQFRYRDAGELRAVASDDVNDYLARVAGHQCTAKDFRT